MPDQLEIPAEVVERCAAQAYEDWFTAAKWSECPEANGYKDHWRKETIAVLRACGYAEMRAALKEARPYLQRTVESLKLTNYARVPQAVLDKIDRALALPDETYDEAFARSLAFQDACDNGGDAE